MTRLVFRIRAAFYWWLIAFADYMWPGASIATIRPGMTKSERENAINSILLAIQQTKISAGPEWETGNKERSLMLSKWHRWAASTDNPYTRQGSD